MVVGQPRATQRYRARSKSHAHLRLVKEIHELAKRFPRYGYRRIRAMLQRDGWDVSLGRVLRIWRGEGLRVPQKRRKRRRLGDSSQGCIRQSASGPNDVWSYDFVMDRTEDGRRLKMLTLVDEYTREALAIHVARCIKAKDVIDVLASVIRERGVPKHIRSDNGPEFIANEVRSWLAKLGAKTLYIEPGSPWQNAYVESFNGKLADELLDLEIFTTLAEARFLVEDWRVSYNIHRPHSSLGYRAPVENASCWPASGLATLGLRPTSKTPQHQP